MITCSSCQVVETTTSYYVSDKATNKLPTTNRVFANKDFLFTYKDGVALLTFISTDLIEDIDPLPTRFFLKEKKINGRLVGFTDGKHNIALNIINKQTISLEVNDKKHTLRTPSYINQLNLDERDISDKIIHWEDKQFNY